MNISVKKVTTTGEMDDAKALRLGVFVNEQGVPLEEELDELDAIAVHAIALDGNSVIGTGRLIPGSGGTGGHIGRMSVLAGLRRHGIGGQILSFLERTARDMGIHQIILHAQVYVKSFYINHGYQEEGSVFIEAGIDHIEMRKDI